MENNYLKWLSGETASCWWNDSAVLQDMDEAIANGATGVTTNPLSVKRSLYGNSAFWQTYLETIDPALNRTDKAEEIIRRITVEIAKKFLPIYRATEGRQGFVCAQVNPKRPGDAEFMFGTGKRLAAWAENIAVKLPATAAGLEVMEELSAIGLTTVGTVSFTVPQAVEIARRQTVGIRRARASGIKPGRAFSVIMVGRLDDYLRDVAHDGKIDVAESDIILAGTAAIKRAYAIVKEQGYESSLMPAGMRGAYHTVDLAGADMAMSISDGIQKSLGELYAPFDTHIGEEIPVTVIERLSRIREFRRAYEPDGMKPDEFITYGATQKTLSQFVDAGWIPIEEKEIHKE
jgi:transaldolase